MVRTYQVARSSALQVGGLTAWSQGIVSTNPSGWGGPCLDRPAGSDAEGTHRASPLDHLHHPLIPSGAGSGVSGQN